jgi:hypothetical protein
MPRRAVAARQPERHAERRDAVQVRLVARAVDGLTAVVEPQGSAGRRVVPARLWSFMTNPSGRVAGSRMR